MRVLIVDDESLIRMDLRDIIESCGHEVVAEGTNGVEALELCKKHKPDIILMDVKMPELDGIEAARQIGFHHEAPVSFRVHQHKPAPVRRSRYQHLFL